MYASNDVPCGLATHACCSFATFCTYGNGIRDGNGNVGHEYRLSAISYISCCPNARSAFSFTTYFCCNSFPRNRWIKRSCFWTSNASCKNTLCSYDETTSLKYNCGFGWFKNIITTCNKPSSPSSEQEFRFVSKSPSQQLTEPNNTCTGLFLPSSLPLLKN